uniref:Uncharacterized protein n=1 Tax=Musa balbisiana TaxID=52838 RepID=Q1EP64_MUSBA|nr:hypothetical protein MBP_81C12.24 [Musa balbisiana]
MSRNYLLEITDARGFPPVPLPADLDVQEDIRENDLAAAAAAVVCNDQAPRPSVVEQDEAGPGRSLAVEEPRVGEHPIPPPPPPPVPSPCEQLRLTRSSSSAQAHHTRVRSHLMSSLYLLRAPVHRATLLPEKERALFFQGRERDERRRKIGWGRRAIDDGGMEWGQRGAREREREREWGLELTGPHNQMTNSTSDRSLALVDIPRGFGGAAPISKVHDLHWSDLKLILWDPRYGRTRRISFLVDASIEAADVYHVSVGRIARQARTHAW